MAVSANSKIVYISKIHVGGISDKAITKLIAYLDLVPSHSKLMADKGFNIADECATNQIDLVIPPGKRGQSQMLSNSVQKTSSIAKMRIIVEQVIREIKTFRILGREIPISLIPQVNDILIICSALTNMKPPIYN